MPTDPTEAESKAELGNTLQNAVDRLVEQGYVVRVTENGQQAVQITDLGRSWLARKQGTLA